MTAGRERLRVLLDQAWPEPTRYQRGLTPDEFLTFLDGYADEVARRVAERIAR